MKHAKYLLTSALLLSVLGAGCNPLSSASREIRRGASERAGEELAERLLEGSAGGNADIELGKIPADFPADVIRYPNVTVNSAVNMKERNVAIANFLTTDSQEKVVEWYDAQYAAAGFEKDESIAKLGLFRVYEKGKVKITVQTQAVPKESKTVITVTRSEAK